MELGVCAAKDRAQACALAGYDYLEPTATAALAAMKTDAEWAPVRDEFLALPLPVAACNLFFPGDVSLVGPARDLARTTEYADKAFERLKAIGGNVQVFGSGKARTPPPDYPREKALDELKHLAARLAPLAARHGVRIAMEHLRAQESALLNTLEETADFVRQVNHPALGLVVDSYHLAQMAEPWDVIRRCNGLVIHVHTADSATRHEPSRANTDLRPFFRELAAIGYDGRISLECAWNDFDSALKPTRDLLAAQWAEARPS